MSFDPTLPATNSEMRSEEMRNQFNGLKTADRRETSRHEKAAPTASRLSMPAASRAASRLDHAREQALPWPTARTPSHRTVQNGTITVVGGIITGIQEASDTPPARILPAPASAIPLQHDYNENGTLKRVPGVFRRGRNHWIFWSTSYTGWAMYSDLSDPGHVDYFKQPAAPSNEVQGNYDPITLPAERNDRGRIEEESRVES